MHSLIKKEEETATMVEHLALLLRQYVVWGQDTVMIQEEIRFAEAYLELQKYRFGERLQYKIDVDEECKEILIPKLSIVTFVENACVHGMENKNSTTWVFVKVFVEDDMLVLEIEDTGTGMQEEECRILAEKMNQVQLEMLKENKSVGCLNAALRLKMVSGEQVHFEVESELGAGTIVTIKLPV